MITIEKSLFLSDDKIYVYFHNDLWESLSKGSDVNVSLDNGDGKMLSGPATAATAAIFFRITYSEAAAFLDTASQLTLWRNEQLIDSFSAEGVPAILPALKKCHDALVRERDRSTDPFVTPKK